MTASTPRIEAVLFDLGGTLVDVRDFLGWAALARHLYLDLEPDALRHAFTEVERELDVRPLGRSEPDALVEFWRRTLSRAAERELDAEVAERFVASVVSAAERPVALYSDVRRCLDTLQDGRRRLGIVSNSQSEASVRRILDRTGIVNYFERVVSSGSEGVSKPDPEIFLRAVRRLGVLPGGTLYVGNLEHTDALAAEAAGLHGVWLNREGTGLGGETPEITSLLEVPSLVRQLESRGPANGVARRSHA